MFIDKDAMYKIVTNPMDVYKTNQEIAIDEDYGIPSERYLAVNKKLTLIW